MLSVLGRCHTFDNRADGYCRAEGCCGAVYEVDGSLRNYGALLDSSVQQDGPSASLTAPNGTSQRRLLTSVGLNTTFIDDAFEAHGTGTALGDPIEIGAAVAALCCPVHSKVAYSSSMAMLACSALKANMGHLETGAAAASLTAVFIIPLKSG